jgi:SDR family mycofactocin-dependent oxidoreductase
MTESVSVRGSPVEPSPLAGRVALITGGARAQGRAYAVRLAECGADIALFDLCAAPATLGYPPASPADLEETVRLVEKSGRQAIGRIGDVRDQEALDAAVADARSAFGHLDIVVANAGVSSWGRFWEMADDRWVDMIDINLTGVWRTLRAAAPVMIEQGRGGSIITVCSVAGMKALPGQAHYTAAKHGVVGLTKAAAIELGPSGIRVNSIHPWGVDTAMAHDAELEPMLAAHPEFLASFASAMPQLGLADPRDVAEVVLFLASDASRFVTGAQIPVDMGATKV